MAHSHAEEHHGDHYGPSAFVKNLFVLMFLMLLTVAVWYLPAKYDSFEWVHSTKMGSYLANGANLTIAIIKACLVITIFMGVKKNTSLVKLWAAAGFIWFTLMFIILADYGTRQYEPAPTWTKEDPGSAMTRAIPPQGEYKKPDEGKPGEEAPKTIRSRP